MKPVELSEVIGGYVLERVLGRGGMGTVYLGKHRLLGRAAAVKVLDAELAGNEQLVSRFFHEARIVNDVRHPNIVDVIDFVHTEDPRRVAFIMEYLEGDSLDRHLKVNGPLTVPQSINAILQVLDGLAVVHAIGAIHRDLKPANLHFTTQTLGDCSQVPVIKVLDFGIAKASGPGSGHKTQTGIVLGTPAYMAPEQVSGDEVSARTDVYAIGEILYELVGGRRLFTGTNTQVLRSKLAQSPPKIELAAELPHHEELRAIIRACIVLEPERRPTTEALIEELRHLRSRLTSSPVPVGFDAARPTTLVPPPAPTPRPPPTYPPLPESSSPMNTLAAEGSLYTTHAAPSRWPFVILAAGLALAGGAIAYLSLRPERPLVVTPLDPPPPPPVEVAPPPPPPVVVENAAKPEKPVPHERTEKKRRRPHVRVAVPPSAPPVVPPPATAPAIRYGRIKLAAWTTAGRQVPAKVKVDGKLVDRTAPLEIKARVGRRRIEIEAVGFPIKVQEVEIEDGQTTNLDVVVDLR